MALYVPIIIILAVLILGSLRQVNQYETALKFTMGRFTEIVKPGWRFIIPVFQSMTKVDMRVKVVDVPFQKAITKDNIPVSVNAVIYYKVMEADRAVLEVEAYEYAVSQFSQTTMRNIAGEVTLDELLGNRDMIAEKIKVIVDKATDDWGIKVSGVELKDIILPPDMERTIAKQAEAEREKRAVIIKAEGEVASASNMAKAAQVLSGTPGALHLRTLQSLNDISSDQSNTIVFALPMEIMKSFVTKKD